MTAPALPPGPLFFETGFVLNRETARRGGIRRISVRRMRDGTPEYEIQGVLLSPIRPRSAAPNYNRRLSPGRDIGLPDYELAHLWGPGFGDEAWDGMMYAPRAVNQEWQNRGIEQRLRDLQTLAGPRGVSIELVAKASAFPIQTWRGHQLLKEASYVFSSRVPGRPAVWMGRVEILVGPPPHAPVTVDVALGELP
jgi:Bacterial toxin 4